MQLQAWSWSSYSAWGAAVLLIYASVCSLLRFRRVTRLRHKYGFHNRASLQRMTNEQAHHIVSQMAQLEFPTFVDLGLRIALFRTYAMEDIAKLLVSSSDLIRPQHAPKRYEDTAAIFVSFIKFPPDSEYLHKAVARMNYLHSPYIKTGKITNRDMLYVLWASMTEPIRFIETYEWRPLTDMEMAALGTFWKYIGDMAQIDYEEELGRKQWQDGLDFLEHVTEWAYRYEDVAMRRLPEPQKLGQVLIDILVSAYPRPMRPLLYKSILVLLGDRVRHAFNLPDPSVADCALVHSLLFLRKIFVRHLMPPRPYKVEFVSDPDPRTGRLHNLHYLKEPWYAPASSPWHRWGPAALLTRAAGGRVPSNSSNGAEMLPQGFLYTDLGPRSTMGRGVEEMRRGEQVARASVSASACPFAIS